MGKKFQIKRRVFVAKKGSDKNHWPSLYSCVWVRVFRKPELLVRLGEGEKITAYEFGIFRWLEFDGEVFPCAFPTNRLLEGEFFGYESFWGDYDVKKS